MKRRVCKTQEKDCYPTANAAIRACLSYSRKRGVALRYYYHHECRSFHVTKKTKWPSDNGNRKVSA